MHDDFHTQGDERPQVRSYLIWLEGLKGHLVWNNAYMDKFLGVHPGELIPEAPPPGERERLGPPVAAFLPPFGTPAQIARYDNARATALAVPGVAIPFSIDLARGQLADECVSFKGAVVFIARLQVFKYSAVEVDGDGEAAPMPEHQAREESHEIVERLERLEQQFSQRDTGAGALADSSVNHAQMSLPGTPPARLRYPWDHEYDVREEFDRALHAVFSEIGDGNTSMVSVSSTARGEAIGLGDGVVGRRIHGMETSVNTLRKGLRKHYPDLVKTFRSGNRQNWLGVLRALYEEYWQSRRET